MSEQEVLSSPKNGGKGAQETGSIIVVICRFITFTISRSGHESPDSAGWDRDSNDHGPEDGHGSGHQGDHTGGYRGGKRNPGADRRGDLGGKHGHSRCRGKRNSHSRGWGPLFP